MDPDTAPTRIMRPSPSPVPVPASVPAAGAETRRFSLDQMRQMQADELTSRARALAQAEDFVPALEQLREALEIDPGHQQAAELLASIQACVVVPGQEVRPRVGETPVPRTAEVAGVDPPTEPLDDRGPLRALRSEAAAARGAAGSEQSTTRMQEPMVPNAAQASGAAALDESLRTIRALRDDGRAGEALERLNRAVREFGAQPTLRILRDELGEALLEQDAEQEESASQMFEVASAVNAVPVPPAGPPPGGVPDLAAAPMRGLADATIRSFEPPAEVAPDRPEPPTAHPTRIMVAVGLILVTVFAALIFVLTREGPVAERRKLEVEDVAAADLSPGSLVLDAVPWAEIVALENPAVEEAPPISPSRFTPVILRLPPGEYWITLRYPPTGQVEERVVRVESDDRVEQRIIFESLDAQAYFERIGW